jgi:DNA polymerase I-like protein with 3'-5' exonuclease and polymerase domains
MFAPASHLEESTMAKRRASIQLPDLRRVGLIALDTETKDERLAADMGSGWPFGAGYICGVSVAYREAGEIRAHYFPLRHPDSDNLDPVKVFQWLRDLITSDVRIVTQDALYDWGWLRTDGNITMPPAERLEEIGALATLVDENRDRYSLAALCAWRGLPGKDQAALQEGAAAIGLPKRAKPQAHIWQMPARFVSSYAEADAARTLALFENLNPVIEREGTRDAYRLEVELLPMVHEMRRRGVRIDTAAAEKARDYLLQKRDAVFAELSKKLGANIGMAEIGRNKWLAATFDKQGIKYPRTEKGNPSFTAGTTGWMHKHDHWLPQLIAKADKYNKAGVDFLETFILGHAVNGRIHAEIHPHRSDEGGARSLRFSYSNPPLQQMAARDEEIAPLIRGVFLPEEGQVWAKPDISQQEFRFIVHYATKLQLKGAEEAAKRYRADPNTDFHDLVAEITGRERKQAKNVNFAKAFGAGVRKFAAMIGKSVSEARTIYNHYDNLLPFVHQLSKRCTQRAASQGYLELYDGARRHWDDWVAWANWTKGAGPCPRDEAERRIKDPSHPWYRRGPLRRADTHKAMNALIQGSAARHTKLWMRACWREGIVPLLQMHDSLDCSVASSEQAERVAELGRTAVTLAVPIQVDLKFGKNWGDAVHTWEELHNGVQVRGVIESEISIAPARKKQQTPAKPAIGDKVLCPFHDDHNPSLQIYSDGHYHCYACGAHGDVEELPETTPATGAPRTGVDTLKRGIELWQAAKSIHGTLAERYLTEIRGLDLAIMPDIDAVLRFHPRCPFDKAKHPCLIALFRDIETDEAAGIHRIALTQLDCAQPRPGAEHSALDFLCVGCDRAARSCLLAKASKPRSPAACELAKRRLDYGPWARPSRSDALPLLAGVTKLMILVDQDKNNVGMSNADICAKRWSGTNRTCVLLCPRQADTDFNDLIKGRIS